MSNQEVNHKNVLDAAELILANDRKPTLEAIAKIIGASVDDPDLKFYVDRWITKESNHHAHIVQILTGEDAIEKANNNTLTKTDELEKSLALVRATLESTSDAIMVASIDNRFLDCNQQFIDMWDVSEEHIHMRDEQAMFERCLRLLVDPEDLYKRVVVYYSDPTLEGELGDIDFKDGRVVKVFTKLHRVNGEVVGRVWSYRDITEAKHREESLRLRQRAIEASMQGVMITDMTKPDQPIIFVNPAFVKMTGYTEEDLMGKNPKMLQGDDRDQAGVEQLRIAIKNNQEEQVIIRNYKKDGTLFWNELFISPVPDANGNVTHFVWGSVDVTERQKMQEQLLHQATHDALTGLPNRSLLLDRIDQSIILAKRHHMKMAVIFLDLDRFKLVNDSAGHGTGDELLVVVGKRLQKCLRASDTLARMGGDEFVVVVNDVHDESDVVTVAQSLCVALRESIEIGMNEYMITASVGVAYYPTDGETASHLIQSADISMYQAKDAGRDTVKLFDKEMTAKIDKRIQLESKLRTSLERNEFVMFYQPIVDIAQERIVGAEALIRWVNPELGMVSPADFIPIAEDDGLIIPIGEWVMREACTQLKKLQENGYPDFSMALNLSGRQLAADNIIEVVGNIINEVDVDPKFIEIELTESVLLDNVEESIKKMCQLKALGVKLSVDDFGTGYSSLGYLKRFPVDKLKIDKTFVDDVLNDADDQGIVRAVIMLGEALGLKVLAEGVEDVGQLAFLRAINCQQIQGYIFSKPLPSTDFELLMDEELVQFAQINIETEAH